MVNRKAIDLRTKLYQMFVLGLEGEDLNSNPNLINALHKGLGGVIFFTQNIKSTEQFKKLVQDIKKEAISPLFLSIDQEGGRVERTENIFCGKNFLSAKFAAQNGEDFVREQTEKISRLLKDFGLNLNFAPVLDVNTNPNNPIIGERAFSSDTDEVIKFGQIVVDTYLKNGIIPCTKHFPGHGDASVDSHISLPRIDLSLEEMEKYHIRPFREVDSPMVMVAHLHCMAFDEEEIPSSMSKNVINYLRNNIGYNGLLITDDMVMGAVIKERVKRKEERENLNAKLSLREGNEVADEAIQKENCLLAIKAGINLLLYRNSYDETIQVIEELAELAQKDETLLNNINASYEKITNLKSSFCL